MSQSMLSALLILAGIGVWTFFLLGLFDQPIAAKRQMHQDKINTVLAKVIERSPEIQEGLSDSQIESVKRLVSVMTLVSPIVFWLLITLQAVQVELWPLTFIVVPKLIAATRNLLILIRQE